MAYIRDEGLADSPDAPRLADSTREVPVSTLEREEPGVSRRGLLRTLLRRNAGAALAAGAGVGLASRSARAQSQPSADVDPGALLSTLVRRVTYHPSADELTLANSLGWDGYIEYHLNHTAIPDAACDALLAPYNVLTMTPPQIYTVTTPATRPDSTTCITQLTDAAIIRAAYSKRQLFERMVEFWTDHFNIDINNGDDAYLKPIDDRDVIRANALGTFPAMLNASARSPAMLLYLDNNVSRVGAPNENYARELMELHTLSVTGGYTQQDVTEVARCFTGWQFYSSNVANGANVGTFRYNSAQHDAGQKVVLGNVIPARPAANGMQDGIDVLNILSNHPNTANFIALKMCRWFLGENPPAHVVAAVKAKYLATGGDIKAMLREILKPGNIMDAGPKYKRPFHLIVSSLRALPTLATTTTPYSGIRSQLSTMGNRPFYWGPPDGYPDRAEAWVGFLLARMSYAASLVNGTTGSVTGINFDDATFFAGLTTATQMADKIKQAIFAGEMNATDYAAVRDYIAVSPGTQTRRREGVGIALGAPAFQWY